MTYKNLTSLLLIIVVGSIFGGVTHTSAQERKSAAAVVKTQAIRQDVPERPILNLDWKTVANFRTLLPHHGGAFDHFGLPSVNTAGTVVFSGAHRSDEKAAAGVYISRPGQILDRIADTSVEVPYPNNLGTVFDRFSAVPRIAPWSDKVAFTARHEPVYMSIISDEPDRYLGRTGIYSILEKNFAFTAGAELGLLPEFWFYGVPGKDATPFGAFNGLPAMSDDGIMVFPGQFMTTGGLRSGIFARPLINTPGGGFDTSELVVDTDTEIPDAPQLGKATTFGWTGSPAAAEGSIVFVGLDSEIDPRYGGIYMTPLKGQKTLTKIVTLGEFLPNVNPVPNYYIGPITQFGESVAFDGRYVAFWATWGDRTQTIRLWCPTEGDPELIDYCNGSDPESIQDKETGKWYQLKNVPLDQGVFLFDTRYGLTYPVAIAGVDFTDMVYWRYDGSLPNKGAIAETPHWSPETFLTAWDGRVAFKARTGEIRDADWAAATDGIYIADPTGSLPLSVMIETGAEGGYIDPEVPVMYRATLPITDVGIERDGLRGNMLAIRVTMSGGKMSWAGIYRAELPAIKK